MRKKASPEADLHINSNIIIAMDDKARLRSNYMKKHSENMQSLKIVDYSQRTAAGVKNFNAIQSG